MRISTSLMFDNGTTGILSNQSTLFKLQNQMSTGRRVLTPADDPVASAQALITTQAQSVNKQYMENQGNARSQLGLLDGNLDSLTNLIHDIRERAIQLGDAALTDKERSSIASEYQARFDELVGLGNAQNGAGQYLFSGFQGATKPFGVSPTGAFPFAAGANAAVTYAGDQGERLLQVDASRQMGVTASGLDVFMRIHNGNGQFAVSVPTVVPLNAGTGISDQGTMLDIAKWNAAPTQPQSYQIEFQVDRTVVPAVTYYNLLDGVTGDTMFAPPGTPKTPWPLVPDPLAPANLIPQFPGGTDWKVFKPDQAIAFNGLDPAYAGAAYNGDLGFQVQISGNPEIGDRFNINSSSNQSLFDTVKNLIEIAQQPIPISSAGNSKFMNDLGGQLSALDNALDNVLRVRSSVGSRLQELDSLSSAGSDLDLQYASRISTLQDLDYASAISDLSQSKMQLEAAQTSFVRVTSLSLFSQM